jgi:hypothetical protein
LTDLELLLPLSTKRAWYGVQMLRRVLRFKNPRRLLPSVRSFSAASAAKPVLTAAQKKQYVDDG